MRFIKDKLSNVNGELGFLFANEFNSLKNELANVVKYRYALNDDSTDQLLKAIVTETKMLHYKDSGDTNEIVLTRDGEIDFKIIDDQVFFFTPAKPNTNNTTLRVGVDGDARPLLLNGTVLEPGYLDSKTTYMATYSEENDTFVLKQFNGGTTSDFIFSEMHNNATFIGIAANEMGGGLVNNDVVFIDQITNKYEKAIYELPNTQRQNAIGIYKRINGVDLVFFSGIVPDFRPNLKPGMKYFLSDTDSGNITQDNLNIYLGRALKDNKFVLDISGDVGIDADVPPVRLWNTSMVDPETKEGNTFTNPDKTLTLMFDKVVFDISVPTVIMFAKVLDKTFKIDFASEYNGDEFEVEFDGNRYGGTFSENETFDNPTVLGLVGPSDGGTPDPAEDNTPDSFMFNAVSNVALSTMTESNEVVISGMDDGTNISVSGGEYKINDSSWTSTPGQIDSGTRIRVRMTSSGDHSVTKSLSLTVGSMAGQFDVTTMAAPVADTVYDTNVVHPVSKEGVTFTDPSETMTLMFDKTTFDGAVPTLIMFISVNGTVVKIDFATEYTGDAFEVEVGGVRFIGAFAENETFDNPITINQK